MSANPYESPKAVQKLAVERQELFDRINKYQWRAFYIGLVMVVITVPLMAFTDAAFRPIFTVLSITGSVLVIASIATVIPLSIWGFVKGYRDAGQ